MAAPCPFCGSQLVQTRTGWQHPKIKDDSPPCPLAGCDIGDGYIDWVGWPRQITYQVKDGVPVFSNDPGGQPVTADFLNACITYLRKDS